MLTNDDITGRNCENIEEFYQRFIINAEINGQSGQIRRYIKKMSKAQKWEFYKWLKDTCMYTCKEKLKDLVVESLCDPNF